MTFLIMDNGYYQSLYKQYDDWLFDTLPFPVQGVPMSAQEYDYKTYWTSRHNERLYARIERVGSIYLISNKTDKVKIGVSVDVTRRLRGLETGSGTSLELLSTYVPKFVHYVKLERLLHNHFQKYRGIGEWFESKFTKEDFLLACNELDK